MGNGQKLDTVVAFKESGVDGGVGDGDVADLGKGSIFVAILVDFEGGQGAVAREDAFVQAEEVLVLGVSSSHVALSPQPRLVEIWPRL